MSRDEVQRVNLSLPARVLRAADSRAAETQESRSGYLARLIREDLERRGLTIADKRFDPPIDWAAMPREMELHIERAAVIKAMTKPKEKRK